MALRLVCEREAAIEAFNPLAYWSIAAMLAPPVAAAGATPAGAAGKSRGAAAAAAAAAAGPTAALIRSRLTHADGRRLGGMDIRSQAEAEELARRIQVGVSVCGCMQCGPLRLWAGQWHCRAQRPS